jgi:PAS domain S-box-containing protein
MMPREEENGLPTLNAELETKDGITERNQAEKDLRLTKFSLEHASYSVFWIGPQAHILYANEAACRALGRSRQELTSLSIPDIDPLFPRERWQAFWGEVKMLGSMSFETQQVHKDGRAFPVEVTANYLEFDEQEYLFAFARDISQRRMLQAQLQHAQKLESIGQLAAGIAHEINTPTQFVSDNVTFLRDTWTSLGELVELYRGVIREHSGALPRDLVNTVQKAERSCDLDFIITEVPNAIDQSLDGTRRITEIVHAMKIFSHPDSTDKTATDLNNAIESTIIVARNEWRYVAKIVTELDDALPRVVCYPGDINQVVLNLLVNAAHAIKDKFNHEAKGQIRVRTRGHDRFVEISVADNGTGIPEHIRGKIFDPFFTTKEVGVGTGQGLAIAYALIVKRHSGRLWFETEAGVGTTFFIDIPIDPPAH